MFSAAPTSINDSPNSHVALFDLSVPGSLPIFQSATLIPALRAAIALKCEVHRVSHFDRKHYFYQDQPAGYQITQYYQPLATNGSITLAEDDGISHGDGEEVTIGVKQIQMEQDTAKSQEVDDGTILLDFNRVGHPLIEIISLPHIHSPETAAAYVRKVQSLLFAVDAVTTGMEMGGLRADVNVSVLRRDGRAGAHQYSGINGLGQRTEIKNLSTLKGVEDAIKAERDRQIALLVAGGTVQGETRGWSLAKPYETRRLRGKEGKVDYRYMPDPDIPPLILGEDLVRHLVDTLPALPDEIVSMLVKEYGLSLTDAKILLQLDDGQRLIFFQEAVDDLRNLQRERTFESYGKLVCNWVLQELGSLLSINRVPWAQNKVSPQTLAEILDQYLTGHITGNSAKLVLKAVFTGGSVRSIAQIIREDGFAFSALSEQEYEQLAVQVMAEHEDQVEQIRTRRQMGKLMFLVGQMMRKGQAGSVEAKRAESVLRRLVVVEGPAQ